MSTHPFLTPAHCQGLNQRIWSTIITEAKTAATHEPLLADYIQACVLQHAQFEASLAFILANKMADNVMPANTLFELFKTAYQNDANISCASVNDIEASYARDPAVAEYLTVLLYFKGYHALQTHRMAHYFWQQHDRQFLALYLQSRNALINGVDIHPAAKIGQAVMFDHATGIVIGETAVIEDNVSLLQGVTLGGTGKEAGDRHPKVQAGVMIGAGAKILGNICIGKGAKVGAGSVVLRDVKPHTTVAGVPAVEIGKPKSPMPCQNMNQNVFDDH